jgi:hypothetical protein
MKRRLLFMLPISFLIMLCAQWLLVSSVEAKSIPPPSDGPASTCTPQILLYVPSGVLNETTDVRLNDCAITAILIGQTVSRFDVVSYYHPLFGIAVPKIVPLSA